MASGQFQPHSQAPAGGLFGDGNGGECAALMRATDWSRTSLGPVDSWPASVRALVPAMLASRFAMRIVWGSDHTMLYNDAYRPILGPRKHPAAMGRRMTESYAEVWDLVGPLFGRVYAGEAVGLDDLLLPLERNGYREECYFTLSYSPVCDDTGAVGGVLGVVHETTERVLAERRLRTLRDLAGATAHAVSPDDACRLAGLALAKNSDDAPFALFYLLDGPNRARLSWQVGLEARPDVAAPIVAVTAERVGDWPLVAAGLSIVDDVAMRCSGLVAGPFAEPVRAAVVLRLDRAGFGPLGFLVVGVNPRRALDDAYRTFFELLSEHIVAALTNGQARRDTELARVRLYSQFMQAPVAVSVVSGDDLVYDLANPLYERMVGRHDMTGRTMAQVFPELPPDAPVFAMLREIHRTGQPFQAEEYPVPLDIGGGHIEERVFKFTCQPLRDATGAMFGIMTVALDVTAQVRARQELSAARGLLEEVVAQMPSGVLIADAATGRIVTVNEQLRRLFGDGAVMTGASAHEAARLVATHADGRPLQPSEHPLLRALAGESLFDEELTIPAADGTSRVVAASAAPIRDGEGRIVAAAATFADVSDRKREEDERRQLLQREREARAEAEVANRSKDEFLAMLGHELRNPLAPILTALQLLRMRHPESGERERGIIERQVEHVRRLVDDLLDVARIRQGRIALQRQRIEMYEAVAKAIEMASPLVEPKRHTLTLDVAHSGLLVDGDPTRLAQIVYNLVTNAAKYTEPGGRIDVAVARQDAHIVLRVRDNGMGLSDEVKPRLFESFVQERQALDRAQGGLGLGLSIVRSLVAMHGGQVFARSDGAGCGSEFIVRLPAADLRQPAPTPPRGLPLVATPMAKATALRILIVDDNVDAAELLRDVLVSFGHDVTVAHDGPTALPLAAMTPFDLALLDIGLPVMDGYELAQQLRRLPGREQCKLFAVTGYGQDADRRRALHVGFDRHLVKPVRIEELQHAIDELFIR